MTEQHLKILSRLTTDVRLAYDGDAAGVNATERAIKIAGALGINLSVISDYHGAKDPDELIQQDPKLWQEAVDNPKPAMDWLLEKYEEKLDLLSAQGKKEYSDMAMGMISEITDPVVKKHYEQLVAKKLDVSLEDLMAKKVERPVPKRLKQVKTKAQNAKKVKILEDALLSIMLFGGEAGEGIELEVPEDETKLEELSLIYETKYKGVAATELRKEVQELVVSYKKELKQQKLEELTAELEKCEDDEEKSADILREMQKIQKD